ncbi:MAG: T9SS C-terminal target domain-containing protein [Chlorobi bacterium]|nr:T9SS C-terminal target domain-containing protein [Chlorobiota bacterium]
MTQFFSFVLRSSIAVLLGAVLLWQPLHAQQPSPAIEWQKALGGSGNDVAYSITQTSDGGYIVAGYSYSTDGDVSGHHGAANHPDFWIVKLTSGGEIEWQKSLGGSDGDWANSITQTRDGGYIVAGYSNSTNGDVSGNHGGLDYWIVKLTSGGEIEWQKSLGGSGDDWASSITQTSDGGYIVAGRSNSTDGDVSGHHGAANHPDFWIVKLTSGGEIEWQKSLGGSNYDDARSITQTSDGGYIVAGSSGSTDGDVSGNHGGGDSWIVKLTSGGEIEWEKSLGGSNYDDARSITQTSDGGYIVAGVSTSNDGDVSGNYGLFDYWIVKLTSGGGIEWQKSLGGNRDDLASSITQTRDGGYIVAGSSRSTDGDVTGHHGSIDSTDSWIVKLTSGGGIEWEKSLGGSGLDLASSITQTSDGGYIVAGQSTSTDGDVIGNHGGGDFWIVKLTPPNPTGVKPTGLPTPSPWAMNANYPNPFSTTTTITFTVPERSFVRLSVDTEQGVEVARLIEEQLEAGEYRVPFSGDGLASGTYLYRLSSGSTSLVGKMTIVR